MKTVLLVMGGLLLTVNTFCQREFIMWPTDESTEKIIFTESVFAPEADVAALYTNAKKFATKTFKGVKDTIIQNDSTKTVFCRSAFFIPVEELGERGKGFIRFSFSIWCHNNSYKYQITDLEHCALNPDGVVGGPLENEKAASGAMLFPPKYWNEQKAKCYYRIQTTIEQFKETMTRQDNN